MKKGNKKFIVFSLFIVLLLSSFLFASSGSSEEDMEYRNGKLATISGRDYLFISNKFFVEVLEINNENELVQVNEIHNGNKSVLDLFVYLDDGKHYLLVTTGHRLIKYDISNPFAPVVVKEKDLYEWRKNRISIGYTRAVTANADYIFVASSKGIKRLGKDNLIDDIIYSYDRDSYSVVADDNKLYGLSKTRGMVFDIETGELLEDFKLVNQHYTKRKIDVNAQGAYFPGENSLIKDVNGRHEIYYNPVKSDETFSYGVSVLPNGQIFYVNGFGVTKFNSSFEKQGFFFAAQSHLYGSGSWASGVDAIQTSKGNRVAVFNKKSVLLLDDNMNFLSRYVYTSVFEEPTMISTELKIMASSYSGKTNDSVSLEIFGFWPNEKVEVKLGINNYLVNVNNLGYGRVNLIVPDMEAGRTVIETEGQNSGLRYQATFDIW